MMQKVYRRIDFLIINSGKKYIIKMEFLNLSLKEKE